MNEHRRSTLTVLQLTRGLEPSARLLDSSRIRLRIIRRGDSIHPPERPHPLPPEHPHRRQPHSRRPRPRQQLLLPRPLHHGVCATVHDQACRDQGRRPLQRTPWLVRQRHLAGTAPRSSPICDLALYTQQCGEMESSLCVKSVSLHGATQKDTRESSAPASPHT